MTQISWSPVQIAYKQAFQATLVAGWEKEGELATMSLEFEYLHRKSRCKMPIGGDDIRNDVFTLGICFSMFIYICTRFHFLLIGRKFTAQSMGSHRAIRGGIQILEVHVAASFTVHDCTTINTWRMVHNHII